jgi:hypothetical protein
MKKQKSILKSFLKIPIYLANTLFANFLIHDEFYNNTFDGLANFLSENSPNFQGELSSKNLSYAQIIFLALLPGFSIRILYGSMELGLKPGNLPLLPRGIPIS